MSCRITKDSGLGRPRAIGMHCGNDARPGRTVPLRIAPFQAGRGKAGSYPRPRFPRPYRSRVPILAPIISLLCPSRAAPRNATSAHVGCPLHKAPATDHADRFFEWLSSGERPTWPVACPYKRRRRRRAGAGCQSPPTTSKKTQRGRGPTYPCYRARRVQPTTSKKTQRGRGPAPDSRCRCFLYQ